MAVFRRLFALALVCLASLGAAQLSDQLAAARVLGSRWKQLSRSAGMVFSGTVLGVETQPAGKGRPIALILTKFQVDRAIVGVEAGQVLTVREWVGAWSTHRAMRLGQRLLIFLYPPSRLGLTSPVGGPLGQVELDSRGEIVRTGTSGAEALEERNAHTAAVNRCATQTLTFSANCEAGVGSAAFAARLKSCPPQNLSRIGGVAGVGVLPPALKRSATPNPTLRADCETAAQPIVTLHQLERAIHYARENASAAPARNKE